MRNYIIGVIALLVLAIVGYGVGIWINPIKHFSFLEWWGVVCSFMIIRGGIDIYIGKPQLK